MTMMGWGDGGGWMGFGFFFMAAFWVLVALGIRRDGQKVTPAPVGVNPGRYGCVGTWSPRW